MPFADRAARRGRRRAARVGRTVVEPPAEPEPERVLLHMPVDVRSVSLAVLAVLASLFALHWAKEVFIPILLGVMFSYALSRSSTGSSAGACRARSARRCCSSRSSAASAGPHGQLSDDANALIESLPDVGAAAAPAMQGDSRAAPTEAPIDKVQQAATELEQAAEDRTPAARRRATARA